MSETERLNRGLTLIRNKIKKNTSAFSKKNVSASKLKTLEREKIKLGKEENIVLSSIQKAIRKGEKAHKKEVKTLNSKNQVLGRENDSLQRQVPMRVEEAVDYE